MEQICSGNSLTEFTFGWHDDEEGHSKGLVELEAAPFLDLTAEMPTVDLKEHYIASTLAVKVIDENADFAHATAKDAANSNLDEYCSQKIVP